MSLWSAFKKAVGGAASEMQHEMNREWGKTDSFLRAVTSSAALMVMADGTAEESEKKKAMDVLSSHPGLSQLYDRQKIETTFLSELSLASTNSGKNQLYHNIDAIKSASDASLQAEDVYLIALDVSVSNSNGVAGPQERHVLDVLAKRLSIDVSKFADLLPVTA